MTNVRNPGPSGGYRFLRCCDRIFPEALYKPLRAMGTWVAMWAMPKQRKHSRDYLALVLDRPVTSRDVFRHFFAFEEVLMLRLRVINGTRHGGKLAPGAEEFGEWMQTNRPALLGTFHIGTSDLLGFLMGGLEKHRTYLVRQRVGNSHDTEQLGRLFGEHIRFVWVNKPEEMLFALKDAATARDGSIALQCDRVDYSSRTALFDFLGAKRLFPITIYHLSQIFDLPVLLSIGLPSPDSAISFLYSSPIFKPQPGESRAVAMTRAREHFQTFLNQVEMLLKEHPYQWFNFLPLNEVGDEPAH